MKKINFKRLYILLGSVLLLTIYYFLVRFQVLAIPCPFKELFHMYCPGCGVTRMILALSKLQIKKAFGYNQAFFILLPFIIVLGIDFIIGYIFNKPYKIITKIPQWVYIVIAILLCIYGIIRNIPGLEYLTPGS